jgi:hypothetical protein
MRPLVPITPAVQRPRASRAPHIGRDPALPLLAMLPLVATAVAWLADTHDASTMTILAVLSFGAAGLGFVRCYFGLGTRNQMPLLVFYLALLFWYYYPCIADAFTETQWHKSAALIRIENAQALTALLLVNLFAFLVAVMNQVRVPWRLPARLRTWLGPRPAPNTTRLFFMVCLGLAVCLAFYIVAAGGPAKAFQLMLASRAEKKPWDREGYEGSTLSAFDVFVEATLLALVSLGLHMALDADNATWRRRGAYALAAITALAWIAIQRGTRSILVEAAAPPLGMYYARVAHHLSKIRIKRTLILMGAFLVMILGANAQRQYRRDVVIEDVEVKVTDSDFFTQCVYAVAVNEREGDFHDSVLLHIIAGPIPRVLWQDKPRMDGMWVYTHYLWGKDTSVVGGNTNPSIVGEYYTNWGFWGVVEVGIFLGLIIRLLDAIFGISGPKDMARFAVLAWMAYFFMSFRMLSYAFFSPVIMSCFVAMVVSRSRWFAAPAGKRKT